MRTIKFRAWDKENKQLYYGENMERGLQDFFGEVGNDPIMQYTGLKDKNGKEIYSGDLFNCIYHFDGCTEHRLEVYWNSDSVGFKLRGVSGECHQPGVIQTMQDMIRHEVIGNIYSNPELLK